MVQQITHELAEAVVLPRSKRRRNKAVERLLEEGGVRVERPEYVRQYLNPTSNQDPSDTLYQSRDGNLHFFHGSIGVDLGDAEVTTLGREDLLMAAELSHREDIQKLVYEGLNRVMTREET